MSGSYPVWPFGCPQSWQEQPKVAVIRSEIDDGYPKVRRRFTKTWHEYQSQWRLEWSQFSAFKTFFDVDSGAGSVPFRMKHPITGADILVRWKEPPQVRSDVSTKPTFDISATLEEVFS